MKSNVGSCAVWIIIRALSSKPPPKDLALRTHSQAVGATMAFILNLEDRQPLAPDLASAWSDYSRFWITKMLHGSEIVSKERFISRRSNPIVRRWDGSTKRL